MTSTVIEWIGTAFGLSGALLLALNCRYSGYGWLLFLASNFSWMAFGFMTDAYGMVTMQAGFTLTSVLGAYRWLRPARKH